MTNPNNAVGTNGAFGGRTSVNAFNDGLAAYSMGILSGWGCTPSSGLTVTLGGDGNTRDVAIAEDNAGNKTTINNISGSPVAVTLSSAPNTNSRIDAIVAYVDNPPTGSSTATDNYSACGLIVVQGTVSSSPSAPTEGAIRTAITADGASGTTAYYVVLATITVANGTTSITSANINPGVPATLQSIISGTAVIGTIASYSGKQVQVSIPTQNNANYRVLLTIRGGGGGYASVTLTSLQHTTTSFVIEGWNNGTSTTSSMRADWLLIP